MQKLLMESLNLAKYQLVNNQHSIPHINSRTTKHNNNTAKCTMVILNIKLLAVSGQVSLNVLDLHKVDFQQGLAHLLAALMLATSLQVTFPATDDSD